VRVLDRGATCRRDLEPARGLEVHVRGRLAARDLLRGDVARKQSGEAGELQHGLEHLAVREDASASGNAAAVRRTACFAPGQQRQFVPVRLEHPLDDVALIVSGPSRHARLVMEKTRPLGPRSFPSSPLHLIVVPAAAARDVPLAHRVPDLLRRSNTPSRSKTTASVKPSGTCSRGRRARGGTGRARSRGRRR
jgi:hypothetical protein